MASEQVLSLRAVNRALLARQLLLDRPRLTASGPGRRDAVTAEAERVLVFGAPGVTHDVRFVPLTGSYEV